MPRSFPLPPRFAARSACALVRLWTLACVAVIAVLGIARVARADGGANAAPIYVLDIQSDGSADDQAKALTTALRSRVRAAPNFALKDSPDSFETLRLVLKCPVAQKPDAACLGRIGDQLQDKGQKAERYIWGEMKHEGADKVTTDVHLWQRGRPDVSTVETYTDHLTDETDETLRGIAERIFAKLTGGKMTGTLTLHAANASGQVFVDGTQTGTIDNGLGKIEVSTGPHTIEVRVPGYAPSTQTVNVTPAADQEVTFTLTPAKAEPPNPSDLGKSKLPLQKILGWTAVGLGVVSLAVGTYEGINFLSLKDDLNTDRSKVPSTVSDVCADQSTPASIDACQKYKDAKNARVMEYVFIGAGAVLVGGGIFLLVTDKGTSTETKDAPQAGVNVVPRVGPQSAGLDLVGRF